MLLLHVDLADLDAAATVVPAAIARVRHVTGLVNNAGITGRIGGFLDGSIEESELLFRVNVLAPIVLTRAAIAHMATDRGGAGGCDRQHLVGRRAQRARRTPTSPTR